MKKTIHLQTDKSSLWTIDNFISENESNILYDYFSDINFQLVTNPEIKVYGKTCITHRRVGFFSDISSGYPFAGQIAQAQPTTSLIKELLEKVNFNLKSNFNGVLINDYRDGYDYIGSHSDDERTLDNGVVAAISLGTTRKFRIRTKSDNKIAMDIPTKNGQLLVMDGSFQKEFKHEVPMAKKIKSGRVSLTFRVHN